MFGKIGEKKKGMTSKNLEGVVAKTEGPYRLLGSFSGENTSMWLSALNQLVTKKMFILCLSVL